MALRSWSGPAVARELIALEIGAEVPEDALRGGRGDPAGSERCVESLKDGRRLGTFPPFVTTLNSSLSLHGRPRRRRCRRHVLPAARTGRGAPPTPDRRRTAHAVGGPQRGTEFGAGGGGALAGEVPAGKVLLGFELELSALALAPGRAPSARIAQPSGGVGLGGMLGIRVRPFGAKAVGGLFVDAHGGVIYNGNVARPRVRRAGRLRLARRRERPAGTWAPSSASARSPRPRERSSPKVRRRSSSSSASTARSARPTRGGLVPPSDARPCARKTPAQTRPGHRLPASAIAINATRSSTRKTLARTCPRPPH